ncbi:putative GTP-binding protein 6 [Babylonia areolata]|uniref:putative GTP-binding protein 6 n=1 Tax=Babylonia areolata TaxID=304850 RepID=UPI003FD5DC87
MRLQQFLRCFSNLGIPCSYSRWLIMRKNMVVVKVMSTVALTDQRPLCGSRTKGLFGVAIQHTGLIQKPHLFQQQARYFHTDDSGATEGEEMPRSEHDDDDTEVPFLREVCAIPDAGHHVMVIQPAVKWGPRKKSKTTPELQLAETCALVSTLPKWKVVRQRVVTAKQPDSPQIFGSGTFTQLKREVRHSPDISAVVVGTDLLSAAQLAELHRAWRVPVFDRYTIVLQIFKDHARTKEAKLQVALAEIPYVRSRLSQIQAGAQDRQTGGASVAGGTGETYMSHRRQILQEKETKLKKALQKVKGQRALLRQSRQHSNLPTVAVVGYTNAGKTTLIKALTGDRDMEPKDQLFATLDVTAHAGRLPNNMTAIFMDTVGFISDIPVTLIDAFAATLEDAVLADVVVHVRDISHPDTVAQKENVLQTLRRMLSTEQLNSMIEVCNKADRNAEGTSADMDPKAVTTSAVSGQGMAELMQVIQKAVVSASGQLEKRFRIPMQGPMLAWLYKEATVKSAEPCPKDCEHLLVDVVISNAAYQRFRKLFAQNKSKSS